MRAEQRPWVQVSDTRPTALSYDINGARIEIGYAILNSGHLPAMNAYVFAEAFSSPSIDYAMQRRHACEFADSGMTALGLALFPNSPVGGGVVTYISAAELKRLSSESSNGPLISPVIVLCAAYRDGSGKLHHTPYVFNLAMSPSSVREGRGCCMIFVNDGPVPPENLTITYSTFGQGEPD